MNDSIGIRTHFEHELIYHKNLEQGIEVNSGQAAE